MVGLRDMVAPQYFGIDWDAIWDVVRDELPALELALPGLLNDKRSIKEDKP